MRSTAAAPQLAALLLLLPALTSCATEALPELERVTRAGFTMDLPAGWQVEIDRDNGADGRHVRTQPGQRVEVGWTLDGGADIDTLDLAVDALLQSHGPRRVERRVEQPPGQLRLFSLLAFDDGPWLAMTQVACREANVLVTVGVGARTRERAENLSEAVLDSFACRSPDLPRLVEDWPVTDLPDSFGVLMEGSPVLMHPDGRWILVTKLSPDGIQAMGADRARAQRMLAAFGGTVGAQWTVQGPATQIRNLSGPAFSWDLMSSTTGAVAASAFTCADGASGYVILAGDDTARTDAATLRALSARFGCPDPSQPSVLDRPGACEMGMAEACDPTDD